MQLRVLLTTVLRNFHVEADPGVNHTIMGLPTHHPSNSRVHFRDLQAYQTREGYLKRRGQPETQAAATAASA